MNFKKLKLWKLLAVGGVVGLVATVPIITTACSSTIESDVIKLKSDIKADNPLYIISSFKNLIAKDKEEDKINKNLLDKNVSKLISNSDKYKSKLIDNYENIKNEIKSISFTSGGSDTEWGKDDTWKGEQQKTIVYYQGQGQLDVNSIDDLKIKLSGDNNQKLKEIMNNALLGIIAYTSIYSSYEFKTNSALLSDTNGDYLRMLVEATKKDSSGKDVKDVIELRIPTSDINYQPIDVKITITTREGSKIKGIDKQDTFIKYDIGVDATPHITPVKPEVGQQLFGKFVEINDSKTLKVDLSQNDSIAEGEKYGSVTSKNLANSLGWLSKKEKSEFTLRQQSFKNISKNPIELELDDKKISEDLKIFNATFSDLIVESSDGKSPSADDYTGQYKIKMKATLLNGYSWDDGLEDKTREIILNSNVGTGDKNENFLINISDATFNINDIIPNATTTNKYEFDDSTFNDIKKPNVKPGETEQDFATFFTQEKINRLIEILNNKLKGEQNKLSVGVKIVLDTNPSLKTFENGIDKVNKKIKIKAETNVGHIFKDSSEKNKSYEISLQSWSK